MLPSVNVYPYLNGARIDGNGAGRFGIVGRVRQWDSVAHCRRGCTEYGIYIVGRDEWVMAVGMKDSVIVVELFSVIVYEHGVHIPE